MATSVLFLVFFIALAILGPIFGADTRDGQDWSPLERRMHHS
ncbi:MAG: hypothetical protein ABJC62_06025 [Frankiaceae bacterium]